MASGRRSLRPRDPTFDHSLLDVSEFEPTPAAQSDTSMPEPGFMAALAADRAGPGLRPAGPISDREYFGREISPLLMIASGTSATSTRAHWRRWSAHRPPPW
jgi:hypothetical protein